MCTEGQRARKEAYKARKAGESAVPVLPSPPSGVDQPGQLERLAREAINALGVLGDEGRLLAEQALSAARVADAALAGGRPHLFPPANRVLNESMDRLRRAAPVPPAPPGMDPDKFDVDAFVDGLTKFDRA